MIGMIHAMVPLAILTMLPVMTGIDRRLTQASGTLGATPAKGFWLVYFPLSLPGAAAFLFAFITSFDELTVAIFVSGGIKTTLPKQMWDDMILQLNPTLAAVSVVVFIVVTTLLLAAEKLRRSS
ncbi:MULTISPECIES: ABC transporter permease subunit [unclassified Ensifer]|uniref:ABC transporter permease n=1 Tax=unclassified Ensifer TaxID=2633371 RepID=UPI0009F53F41|nr:MULTISPECIES: ABC transporter permease subunit [unclassified Ensifer]